MQGFGDHLAGIMPFSGDQAQIARQQLDGQGACGVGHHRLKERVKRVGLVGEKLVQSTGEALDLPGAHDLVVNFAEPDVEDRDASQILLLQPRH